jgi:hypothetical protein
MGNYTFLKNTFFSGTSNWSEEYYTTSAGLSFVFEPIMEKPKNTSHPDLREQMEQIFLRDYKSPLAKILPDNYE